MVSFSRLYPSANPADVSASTVLATEQAVAAVIAAGRAVARRVRWPDSKPLWVSALLADSHAHCTAA